MLSQINSDRETEFSIMKNQILDLIKDKVFIGRYTEKCYVESLQTYRDIVITDSSEDIVPNLWKTKKLLETYAKNEWIGITNDLQNSESNDCVLWVIINNNNLSVGKHWFQIEAISFEAKEIMLEIKHVQPYRSPNRTFTNIESDFPTLQEIFTYHNMCEATKFSVIVFLTFATFVVESSKFILNYILQIGNLIINFVHVSNPIWLGLFEFLSKCIYGFFWLIYVLWTRPKNSAPPNAILENNKYNRRSYQSPKQICYR